MRPVIKEVLISQSLVPLEKWWSNLSQPKPIVPPSIKSALRSQKAIKTETNSINGKSEDQVNGINGSVKRSNKEVNNDTTEVLNGRKKVKKDKKKSH